MKRQHVLNLKCNHEGCSEFAHYNYNTKKEYAEGFKRHNKNYKCVRHSAPNEVLNSTDNLKTEKILINGKSKKHPNLDGLFWDSGSSFSFGNGWKAFANDFPEGTKIKVTAEIILP